MSNLLIWRTTKRSPAARRSISSNILYGACCHAVGTPSLPFVTWWLLKGCWVAGASRARPHRAHADAPLESSSVTLYTLPRMNERPLPRKERAATSSQLLRAVGHHAEFTTKNRVACAYWHMLQQGSHSSNFRELYNIIVVINRRTVHARCGSSVRGLIKKGTLTCRAHRAVCLFSRTAVTLRVFVNFIVVALIVTVKSPKPCFRRAHYRTHTSVVGLQKEAVCIA